MIMKKTPVIPKLPIKKLPRHFEPEQWAALGKSPVSGRKVIQSKVATADEQASIIQCLKFIESFSFQGQLDILNYVSFREAQVGEHVALFGKATKAAQHRVDLRRLAVMPDLVDDAIRVGVWEKYPKQLLLLLPVIPAHLSSLGKDVVDQNVIDKFVHLRQVVEQLRETRRVYKTLAKVSKHLSPYEAWGEERAQANTTSLAVSGLVDLFMAAWQALCNDREDDATIEDRVDAFKYVMHLVERRQRVKPFVSSLGASTVGRPSRERAADVVAAAVANIEVLLGDCQSPIRDSVLLTSFVRHDAQQLMALCACAILKLTGNPKGLPREQGSFLFKKRSPANDDSDPEEVE